MTLEEAIDHSLAKAKQLGDCDCGKEHLQLAEWLTELLSIRNNGRFHYNCREILNSEQTKL